MVSKASVFQSRSVSFTVTKIGKPTRGREGETVIVPMTELSTDMVDTTDRIGMMSLYCSEIWLFGATASISSPTVPAPLDILYVDRAPVKRPVLGPDSDRVTNSPSGICV